MKIGRNESCPCGSGRKYKRCCLERDEGARREEAISRIEPSRPEPQTDHEAIWAALEESVAAVTSKDRDSLSKRLDAFADLLREDAGLVDLRFAAVAFSDAVEHSLHGLGRARGAGARRRLFRLAMTKLGDRRTLQPLGEQLARATKGPTLSPSNREAVAAALVCMAPVLETMPLPASESPTVEIIFNVQLEEWLARRETDSGSAEDVVKRLLTSA